MSPPKGKDTKQPEEIYNGTAERRSRHQCSGDTVLYHLLWPFVLSPWEGVFLILHFFVFILYQPKLHTYLSPVHSF